MSEHLSEKPSPLPLEFMEDFSERAEPGEAENLAAQQAFDGLMEIMRAKYGKTNEYRPAVDLGPCLWLTHRGGELATITIGNYSDEEIEGDREPYVMIEHADATGKRDFDYEYRSTADGVQRDLYSDYVSELVSPEKRLLSSILGHDTGTGGYPPEQTNGLTRESEVEALKAFLLECE